MKPVYFASLHALRFVAASLVIFAHARAHLQALDVAVGESFLYELGSKSVDFFFVLSGFLITYLALHEYESTGRIAFRYFYMRRVLRILPLYYLSAGVSLFFWAVIVPHMSLHYSLGFPLGEGALLLLLMLPNVLAASYPLAQGGILLFWSIGVEEQFYLIFPLIVCFLLRIRYRLLGALGLFAGYILCYHSVLGSDTLQGHDFLARMVRLWRFHYMFAGVSLAVASYYYADFFRGRVFNSVGFQLCVFGSLVWMLYMGYGTVGLRTSALYVAILAFFGFSTLPVYRFFGHRFLVYLGALSYGMYVWHPLVSYPIRFVVGRVGVLYSWVERAPFLYVLLLWVATICVSHVSYQYFERYFLSLKARYQDAPAA